MFYYTEKTERCTRWEKPAYQRSVIIHKDAQPVGVIRGIFYMDGTPAVEHWNKDKPMDVEYYTERTGNYFRTNPIGRCKTVAEGKRIFADWYAEHRAEVLHADVRALPASPDAEFFPTPTALAGRMVNLIDWRYADTMLEPSAGKGDLISCALKCFNHKHGNYRDDFFMERVDCIERDANLQMILKGKGYRVVSDDFLTYFTMKHYDVILMNPPFSNGDEHLLKAISMQKDAGGQIVSLLNAETIRNPYTQRRKVLQEQLARYEAKIEFVSGAFSHAERQSDVEVAIVYLRIPEPERKSNILEGLKRAAEMEEERSAGVTDLVAGDWMDQLVSGYNMEAKAGVALMREYNALAPYIMNGSDTYSQPLIQLSVNDHKCDHATSDTINSYLRGLRSRYWNLLLSRRELTEKMTSDLHNEYYNKISEMKDYDFSRYNIQQVMLEISARLSRGVEDAIYKLFDELSAEHAWYPECAKNIHYYSGWATNKAHKVGMKVILPINGFYTKYDGKKKLEAREFSGKIADIERALNYLDRGETGSSIDPYTVAHVAEQCQRTTMNFKYFTATFYKKGTCHIKFDDDAKRLIDRLNIFAARSRQWLPPDYGKKHYNDMDAESRAVVDEFQGREEYEEVMRAPQNYIISPASTMPLLTA